MIGPEQVDRHIEELDKFHDWLIRQELSRDALAISLSIVELSKSTMVNSRIILNLAYEEEIASQKRSQDSAGQIASLTAMMAAMTAKAAAPVDLEGFGVKPMPEAEGAEESPPAKPD